MYNGKVAKAVKAEYPNNVFATKIKDDYFGLAVNIASQENDSSFSYGSKNFSIKWEYSVIPSGYTNAIRSKKEVLSELYRYTVRR